MVTWFKARYRAFQESYDPDEAMAGSSPLMLVVATATLVAVDSILGYAPVVAPAAQLRHPWAAVVLALVAPSMTYAAWRHRCRGPIGTLATLLDNLCWNFAMVYVAVNTTQSYGIGIAVAYAMAVSLVVTRVYGLTLLFGVVLLLPVAVLVPWFKPSPAVTLILSVAAVLSLLTSDITARRKKTARAQKHCAAGARLDAMAEEGLLSVLVTAPPRTVAGKYRIERVIGSGGVGVVVAARHLALEQTVALKFLRPASARDDNDRLRFQREAQSAVQLKNEHVCRVLDVGESEEGLPFIVLEYLEGRDLGQVLHSAGPLSVGETVGHLLQVCEGVAEAHLLGMVHRDLKLSNFFLTQRPGGTPLVKVLDFGIAKYKSELDHRDVRLTQTRTLLGSPVYMSPEQIRNARTVDQRSDIWSLGVCLYELLTDRVPFGGDTVTAVAAAVAIDPAPPITEYCQELPDALARVIDKCLAKNPESRYQTVPELVEALLPFEQRPSRCVGARVPDAPRTRLATDGTESGDRARPGSERDNWRVTQISSTRDERMSSDGCEQPPPATSQ